MTSYPNGLVNSQGATPTCPAYGNPCGYFQGTNITSSSTLATIIGQALPAGATTAIIIVEGAGARYRDDGVAPTAAVGMPLAAYAPFPYTGALGLAALRIIPTSGSLTVNVSFYK